MATIPADDPPKPAPEDQLSFTGDGERAEIDDDPPPASEPPPSQPSRQALRTSGLDAARRILSAITPELRDLDPHADDAALAERLVAAVLRLPRSSAPRRRQSWRLRPGARASRGLAEWLRTADLADGTTALVALQLDVVRGVLGDAIFDLCFGPASGSPVVARLVVGPEPARTPLESLCRFTEAGRGASPGEPGRRPVRRGEWYAFRASAATDEPCVYLGEEDGVQRWAGAGLVADEETIARALGDGVALDLSRGLALSSRALAELIERFAPTS